MSAREYIDDIDWSSSTRLGAIVAFLTLFIGLAFTGIGILGLIVRVFIPLLMLLFPWFWVWDVPRRYFFQAAPIEYVKVFGWAGILFNLIYVFIKLDI